MSKNRFRKVRKWSLWIVVILLVLLSLPVTLLAYPQILVHNRVESGTVVLYYDGEPSPAMQELATAVDTRLGGCKYYDATRSDRVFYFHSQKLYSLFARLSLQTPRAQGFSLAIFGNSFVSHPRVTDLAKRRADPPRYSIREGDPVHTIAHEIAHQYISDRIGRSRWQALPHWRREGLPEYIANIGAIRQDSAASLPTRYAILVDDSHWDGSRTRDWSRIHYEAELLVEYLLDVEGLSLEEILPDSVTSDDVMGRLTSWCEQQKS